MHLRSYHSVDFISQLSLAGATCKLRYVTYNNVVHLMLKDATEVTISSSSSVALPELESPGVVEV